MTLGQALLDALPSVRDDAWDEVEEDTFRAFVVAVDGKCPL